MISSAATSPLGRRRCRCNIARHAVFDDHAAHTRGRARPFDVGRRTPSRHGLSVGGRQISNPQSPVRNTTDFETLNMTYRFREGGPRVRLHLPPAASRANSAPAGVGSHHPGAQAQAMRSRSSIASTLAVPTTHALSRRALSVAARCTGVSIAPCERTANAANAIY